MVKLEQIKAKDIMQTDIVALDSLAPVQEAIETIEDYHISGAPVLNEAGELVGVLSASDIVKGEHVQHGNFVDDKSQYYKNDPLVGSSDDEPSFSKDEYLPEFLDRETVADWMTPHVISVAPDESLKEVCGLMAREEIHRVFVVENKRLKGVISTFDIVRFLSESS